LFVSDSRGINIDSHFNYYGNFHCNVARRATMRKAIDIAMRMQCKKPSTNYDMTIIAAGICNFTKRSTTNISCTTNAEEMEA
jgi:hypothetical protein